MIINIENLKKTRKQNKHIEALESKIKVCENVIKNLIIVKVL